MSTNDNFFYEWKKSDVYIYIIHDANEKQTAEFFLFTMTCSDAIRSITLFVPDEQQQQL